MKQLFINLFVFIFLITSFFAGLSFASQEDVVILNSAEIISLEIPENYSVTLTSNNQNCEITTQRRDENSNYLDSDNHIFESKAGQAFERFVNFLTCCNDDNCSNYYEKWCF